MREPGHAPWQPWCRSCRWRSSAPLLAEALQAARGSTDEGTRARALAELTPYLPEPEQSSIALAEAFRAAGAIADEGSRVRALIALVPNVGSIVAVQNKSLMNAPISIISSALTIIHRMVPQLAELGEPQLLRQIARAIRSTAAWWP